jgi:hypothetical protein
MHSLISVVFPALSAAILKLYLLHVLQNSEDLYPSLPVHVTSLSAGFSHVALIRNGAVYTWGNAVQGCLGKWILGFSLVVTFLIIYNYFSLLEFCLPCYHVISLVGHASEKPPVGRKSLTLG